MSLFQALLTDGGAAPPAQLLINQQVGYIIWGQSNALGFNAPDTPSTGGPNYQNPILGIQKLIQSSGKFNTLWYGINSDGTNYGCELSLGYALNSAVGRPIFFGLEAINGTPLYNKVGHDNWSPSATGGDREIDNLLSVFTAVLAQCSLYGKDPYIISVFIGGETDTEDATNVRANYEATIAYLEANGAQIDAHIISILNEDYANGTAQEIADVRAGLTAYCNANNNAYPLEMNAFTLGADSVHFTGLAQEAIGVAVAGIITNDIFSLGVEVYPGSYSSDAKNSLKNFRDDIPTGYKDAVADFVDGLQTDGNLDNIVVCQIRAMSNMQSAMTDIMGRHYGENFGGTHDPGGGITYNGTSDYTDTGFQSDADGDTRYTLNNAGFGFYVVDNLTGVGVTGYLGGFNALGSTNSYLAQGAAGQLAYAIHSNAGGAHPPIDVFADNTLYLTRRTAATGAGCTGLIQGSTVIDGDNVNSNSIGNRKMYEGAKNNIGTADSFINAKVGLFVVFNPTSFDYAAFKTRVDTLIADLAAL